MPTALETFVTMATSLIGLVTSSIAIMAEPPVSYFVGLAAVNAGIKMTKGLIPRKK